MNNVKYKYAYDGENKITSINMAAPKQAYTCLSCGRKLIPVVNVSKKQKHFRHAVNDPELHCSPETYLHKLAKQVFHESYSLSLDHNKPYNISISIPKECTACKCGPCSLGSTNNLIINLAEYFTHVHLPEEVCESGYRPDIVLRSESGETLWVEIAVTHQVSKNKQTSGKRIVEIHIETEDDIAPIKSAFLPESDKVRFFNFKRDSIRGNFRTECNKEVKVFALFRDGKSRVLSQKASQHINGKNLIPSAVYSRVLDEDEFSCKTVSWFVQEFFSQSINSTFCLMCCHYCWDHYQHRPFCLGYKQRAPSAPQNHCARYLPISHIPQHSLEAEFRNRWQSYVTSNLPPIPPVVLVTDKNKTLVCTSCGKVATAPSEDWGFIEKHSKCLNCYIYRR